MIFKMLKHILVFFVCAVVKLSYGQGGCPANVQERIMECVAPLQDIMMSPSNLQAEKCGPALDGLSCLNDVMNSCENAQRTLQQMLGGIRMIQDQINSICNVEVPTTEAPLSNAISTCSKRDERRLQRCSRKMQRYSAESPIRCRKVRRSLDCIANLMTKCSSLIGSETVDRMLAIRQNIMDVCVEGNEIDEEEENEIDEEENNGIGNEIGNVEVAPAQNCPSDFSLKIQNCAIPMQSHSRPGSSIDLARSCRVMNDGLSCIEDLMGRCASEPEVQALASMLNLDHMRAMLRSKCNGGPMPTIATGDISNENCPSDFAQKIQDCATPMQGLSALGASRNLAHACSVAMDGLGCLDQILTDCAGRPEVQAISGMMNLDQMRSLLNQQCANIQGTGNSGNGGSGGNVDSNCPTGYAQQIVDCVDPLQRLDEMQDLEASCSTMRTSLQCVGDLMDRCANAPDVQALNRMLNLDQVQSLVNSRCSGGPMPTIETGGGSDENCPSDYEVRLNDCSQRLQSLSSPGAAQNLARSCSVVRDGLGCLEQIFNDCSSKPEIQAIRGMIDLDEMKDLVESSCSSTSPGISGTSETSGTSGTSSTSCRYGDPTTQLQNCNRVISAFNDESIDLASRCRGVFRGFDCFDELIASCQQTEAVRMFTSTVNLNQARQALEDVCP